MLGQEFIWLLSFYITAYYNFLQKSNCRRIFNSIIVFEGNHYMEKVRDEMIKMSRDESERYLYLREQMAIRDKESQLRSAENRGRREGREEGRKEGRKQGEILKLITMVKKKIENGDSIAKIADDLLEDADVIEKIYDIVKENPEKTREEICEILMNQKI